MPVSSYMSPTNNIWNGSPMVYHHVQGVIYEVANGEADKGVAGRRERGDEVVLHLRGLQVQLNSQTGGRNMTHKQ